MSNNTIKHPRVMNMSTLAAELERQLEDYESYSLPDLKIVYYTISHVKRSANISAVYAFSEYLLLKRQAMTTSSFLDSSSCSVIYFLIVSSFMLPIVVT